MLFRSVASAAATDKSPSVGDTHPTAEERTARLFERATAGMLAAAERACVRAGLRTRARQREVGHVHACFFYKKACLFTLAVL